MHTYALCILTGIVVAVLITGARLQRLPALSAEAQTEATAKERLPTAGD